MDIVKTVVFFDSMCGWVMTPVERSAFLATQRTFDEVRKLGELYPGLLQTHLKSMAEHLAYWGMIARYPGPHINQPKRIEELVLLASHMATHLPQEVKEKAQYILLTEEFIALANRSILVRKRSAKLA